MSKFHRAYITESFKREKERLFFSLKQGKMSITKYVDRFKDLYRFVQRILNDERDKCHRFYDGLQHSIRMSLGQYDDRRFHALVDRALEVEKLIKEGTELEQRKRK